MRLEGIAYLPEPGEDSRTWTVPESLTLLVQFDPRKVIGRASLTKDADGVITAVAHVPEGAVLLPTHDADGPTAPRDVTRKVLELCPRFAVGISDAQSPHPRLTRISVVPQNVNPLIEPYERFEDEGEAEEPGDRVLPAGTGAPDGDPDPGGGGDVGPAL